MELQRKLRLHLVCKEEEIRQVRAKYLKRQNDEEEARLQRLAKNGERYGKIHLSISVHKELTFIPLLSPTMPKHRVRFRQCQLQKKAKILSEELEKSYNIEVERQRRLNALAASVPYYAAVNSTIPNI